MSNTPQAMGEWGSEEQLLAWGRESESILGEDGVRRPKGSGNWVDVIADIEKR